ncbi:hypothetical protein TWF106_000294 [Orbilia oligospora]|uniref:F-box domain-containing protein n=1 Tax=Orbilia oligospora TaxID=2813651 RepID=A0A6G1MLD3_ORBOL|nr:hypothetical protein TWF679_001881 [Orbilia oligospora]KAF3220042.1 hypothetical protein TWF191_007613 [Orbilia oligospora]KAF3226553.1 hypothetical protein TWF106_000294 [Orbilia oligospora]KAF3261193.1 hypothetical protein TWF192_009125 [Orbilia oligospora]
MANITTLPYELIRELSSQYLTPACLKSLRIAFPTPIISSATASLLFHTVTFRLGNHQNSHEKLVIKSKYIKDLSRFPRDDDKAKHGSNKNNTSDGIFEFVKKVVVDVRHPFAVTEKALGHIAAEGRRYRFRPQGELTEFEEIVGVSEADLFWNTVDEMFAKVTRRGQLRVFRLFFSDVTPYEQIKRLLSLVCTPSASRSHHISVSYTIRESQNLEKFLGLISDCNNLEITFETWPPEELKEYEIDAIITTISKCPDITGLGIFTRHRQICAEGVKKLWEFIFRFKGLERLSIKTMTRAFPKVGGALEWKELKTLELVMRDPCHGINPFSLPPLVAVEEDTTFVGDVLKSINQKGVKLEKLTLNRYNTYIQEGLMLQTGITSLEIRGKMRTEIDTYASSFWQDVIPILAPKLKSLRVYSPIERGWSWYAHENNPAKLAIRKCQKLEELMISSWQEGYRPVNYILDLVTDLLLYNPCMRQLNMKACIGNMRKKMGSIDTYLDMWAPERSELPELSEEREFEVIYDRKTDLHWVVGPVGSVEGKKSLAWDKYLQRWKLRYLQGGGREKNGMFCLDRYWDECRFDE